MADYIVTVITTSHTHSRAEEWQRFLSRSFSDVRERGPVHKAHASGEALAFTASCNQGLSEEERREVNDAVERLGADVFMRPVESLANPPKLFVFDMDSTIIQAEVIDRLAARAGAGTEVSAITESAMRGEIDFRTSLRQRVALLEGLREEVFVELEREIDLGVGLEALTQGLHENHCKTAIVSGGFGMMGRKLQKRFGFDYVFTNELEVIDGSLSGRLAADIIDGQRKAKLLTEVAERERIPLSQVVAVGDGANDLLMLAQAGIGVAYHAKPVVRAAAKYRLTYAGLDALLYLL